tara:strand:- start:1349 stop:4555 length:3207 start_codon:yes stop_codon:yes gene_type:complete
MGCDIMFRNFLKISLLSVFISPILLAQELTSDITGSVSSSSGSVSGAQVEITYEPTNTTVTRTTDASGRYSAGGLRPGGPYTVKVSAAGLMSDQVTTSLVVGETSRLSFTLQSSTSVDEVTVTAERISSDDGLGFSSTIDAQTIQETPSVTRDIKDLIKLNPLVSLDDAEDDYASISIGGAHPRSNDIKVDGVSFNDDFGLNDNGYPSQRSPINLDAIEQMSVKVAPASVEYSNFRGGIIEFVTKGGTNEFEGSVGYYDRGDQFYGDKIEGNKYTFDKEDTAQSFTFGGPIIKDKAFFYVTYEDTTVTNPVLYGPAGSGAANEQAITLEQVDSLRQLTISKYGWDPLGVASTTESKQENTSLRIDYILNENHRLTYNYKNTEGDRLRASGSNSSFYFESASYFKGEKTDTSSILLVSDWSDSLISEIYYSNKSTDTSQNSPAGQDVPNFYIDDAYGMRVYLGADIYRSANKLATETDFLKAKLTYYTGNHKITAGYENTTYDIYNVFIVAQDGEWEFDTLADYQAGVASSFSANNAKTGNVDDAAAIFDYGLTSIYLMDEITISDRFSFTAGIRHDEYDSNDAPAKNAAFEQTYGFANAGIDGTSLTNIRLGFDIIIDDVSDLNATFGTYSAKLPAVWISNAYTNDGVRVSSYNSANAPAGCDPLTSPGAGLPACVQQAIQDAPLTDAKIDFIAPSFEWPDSKILNITYTRDLPNNMDMSITYLKSKQEEALYKVIDTGYPLDGDIPTVPTEVAPDGRPIYNMTGRRTYKAGLYNDCCGEREVISATLNKAFRDGDTVLSLSYTGQNNTELSGMTSSTSNSNYGKTGAIDFNNRRAMTSIYETEHRLLATLRSKHYFFGPDKPTTFTLIFERKSGLPAYPTFDTFTGWTGDYKTKAFGYDYNLNDDSSSLLYIPTRNDPIVCYSYKCTDEGSADALAREEAVLNLLYNVFGLEGKAGEIADRGSMRFPWQSSLDFKVTQILPGFRDNDEFVITLGIENLLNLIDDDKGVVRYGYYSGRIPVIDLRIVDGTKYDYSRNAYRYSFDDPYNMSLSATQSVWRAQLGFKYNF